MNDETTTPNDRYQWWLNAVNEAWKAGWKCETDWIFRSPKGTVHDLSAADFSQLDRIQNEGLFAI